MKWFLNDNSALARALRTAAQGILATIITWASAGFEWDFRYLMATMIPVILSPVMKALGDVDREE